MLRLWIRNFTNVLSRRTHWTPTKWTWQHHWLLQPKSLLEDNDSTYRRQAAVFRGRCCGTFDRTEDRASRSILTQTTPCPCHQRDDQKIHCKYNCPTCSHAIQGELLQKGEEVCQILTHHNNLTFTCVTPNDCVKFHQNPFLTLWNPNFNDCNFINH